jgi:hypothetical protein
VTYVKHRPQNNILLNGLAGARVHGAAAANDQPPAELELVARLGPGQHVAAGHVLGHVVGVARPVRDAAPHVVHGQHGLVAGAVDGLGV